MPQFRVTKYNPAHRDLAGAFVPEEWTSFNDIGRTFSGVKLTVAAYEATEAAYVAAAIAYLREAGTEQLQVIGLEARQPTLEAPLEGSTVPLNEIESVLRCLLRGKYRCRLEAVDAFVHVGWDYYMYIGVPSDCPGAVASARLSGLFVESFESPYATSAA